MALGQYQDKYDYHNSTLDASNVQFLSGSQNRLNLYLVTAPSTIPNDSAIYGAEANTSNKYRGAAKEGAFYLTSDTHRLYIGRSIKITSAQATALNNGISAGNYIVPVPVNEGIETVENIDSLPLNANQGEFYYIKPYTEDNVQKGNILAVRSGNSWVQLNTDTHIGSVASTITKTEDASNNITEVSVKTNISDSNGTPFGNGTLECWKLIPGNNVIFSYTDPVLTPGSEAPARLTVAAIDTTYTVGTRAATTSEVTENSDKGYAIVTLTPGGNANANSSSIKFKSAAGSSGEQDHSDLTVSSDANGTVTYTLKEIDGISVSARSGNNNNNTGFNILPVVDGTPRTLQNSSYSSLLDPTIRIHANQLGVGNNEPLPTTISGTDVNFSNGVATLDVYTRLETEKRIEDKLNAALNVADALKYIGTASYAGDPAIWSYLDGNDIAVTTFHKGDVFKVYTVSTNVLVSGIAVKVGDLLIANGSENNNGVIPIETVHWDVIPSGDEPVYSFSPVTTQNSNPRYENKLISTVSSSTSTVGSTIYTAGARPSGNPDFWNEDSWITVNATTATNASSGYAEYIVNYTHTGSDSVTLPTDTDYTKLTYTGASDEIEFLALNPASPFTISKGHVTAVSGKKVKIALNRLKIMHTGASPMTITSGLAAAGYLSGATLNLTVQDQKTYQNLTGKEIQYLSKTLTITGGTGGSGDNSYGKIDIDLLWGSF